jgi:hypothetical protein
VTTVDEPRAREAAAAAREFDEWETPLDLDRPRDDLGGLSLTELRAVRFEQLGRFKQSGGFPHGYDRDYLTFYSPRDTGVHHVLLWALLQAKSSVAINMYGFDDPHMASLLAHYARQPGILVTLTLDSSQAAGPAEKPLLEKLRNDMKGNSIAIGRSERGAISHDKLMVIDGLYLISGSTNWSFGGETKQDNQMTLTRDPIACAEARAVIDLNHDVMLKQMAAKGKKKRSGRFTSGATG